MSRPLRLLAALAAAAFAALTAAAQPAGAPVQLVVPYPAGGPTDVLARVIAPPMARALGKVVIVQNTPGASGALAAQKLLDAPADGQFVLVGDPNATILAPLALGAVKYKPEDFVLLRNLGTSPYALVGKAALRAASVDELVASRPRGLAFGSSGNGSLNHLAGEDLRARTGLDMVHVPYKGGAQLLQDLIGGQVDLAFVIMNEAVAELVRTGKLRMLGLATPARIEKWHTFPTLAESKALDDFSYELWAGLMVPRTTPPAVVAALHDAADAAMDDPEVRAFLAKSGIIPVTRRETVAQVGSGYRSEVGRYRGIAAAIKLVPQ